MHNTTAELNEITNNARINFEIYLNNLSIDKIRKEYDEYKSKYFKDVSEILNNLTQKIIGFPALKGDFLSNDICKFVSRENWQLVLDYHFGGYGKVKADLISFLNEFYIQTNIPLDPIYTGKMMFGIFDLIEKGYFPNGAKILAIHTGGLQGIRGVNKILKEKKKEFLIYEE